MLGIDVSEHFNDGCVLKCINRLKIISTYSCSCCMCIWLCNCVAETRCLCGSSGQTRDVWYMWRYGKFADPGPVSPGRSEASDSVGGARFSTSTGSLTRIPRGHFSVNEAKNKFWWVNSDWWYSFVCLYLSDYLCLLVFVCLSLSACLFIFSVCLFAVFLFSIGWFLQA